MKASERRLLMLFLVLAVVLGSVLLGQRLRSWQKRLERREFDAELAQKEAAILLQQAPEWLVKGQWLAQAQPVVTSEYNANNGLLETVSSTAAGAGLEVTNTQIEPVNETASEHYRQYGVALRLRGTFPELMRWVHARLEPMSFYVIPKLKITPDKEDPEKVTAQVVIWRWYSKETPAAPEETTAPSTEDPPSAAENPTPATENPTPAPTPTPAPAPEAPATPDPANSAPTAAPAPPPPPPPSA